MPAPNANSVAVGVTGAVYRAPMGTTLPTTAAAALNAAFIELGYVSEEGIQETQGTQTNDIRAWQNGTIVRKVQTSHDLTYDLSMLEVNAETIAAYYGNFDNATNAWQINAAVLGRFAWVFDIIDGTNRLRIVLPEAEVTNRGAISYVNGDAVKFPLTLTAYEHSTYAGTLSARAKAYAYGSTTAWGL
jgi:hypothetical protein